MNECLLYIDNVELYGECIKLSKKRFVIKLNGFYFVKSKNK